MSADDATPERPRRSFLASGNPFAKRADTTRAQARGLFGILTVCTGNICRSPLAELMLADRLHGLPVEVGSAGTYGMVGEGVEPTVAEIASQRFGLDPTSHRARKLSERQLRDADLILVLTERHLTRALDLVPAAVGRTFTLTEYARISRALDAADADPRSLSQHVELAGRLRGAVRSQAAQESRGSAWLDVADPMGKSREVHEVVADEIDAATRAIATSLRAATQAP